RSGLAMTAHNRTELWGGYGPAVKAAMQAVRGVLTIGRTCRAEGRIYGGSDRARDRRDPPQDRRFRAGEPPGPASATAARADEQPAGVAGLAEPPAGRRVPAPGDVVVAAGLYHCLFRQGGPGDDLGDGRLAYRLYQRL